MVRRVNQWSLDIFSFLQQKKTSKSLWLSTFYYRLLHGEKKYLIDILVVYTESLGNFIVRDRIVSKHNFNQIKLKKSKKEKKNEHVHKKGCWKFSNSIS